MLKMLPKFARNFYFISGFFFLTWMFFFDSNDLITQFKLSRKLADLEDEREYYVEKIKEVKEERKELLSNKHLLEKFAREKYLMKKPTEDLFIIQQED